MSSDRSVVGTYSRDLGASLERMFENAVDWEHLPWLHSSSFSSIECDDAGPWGFRASVGVQPSGAVIGLELLLDRDRRQWVSRTSDGTEIWTVATATGEQTCRVDVEFHVPRPPNPKLGRYYVDLYTRLYDEDESMMIGRQAYLDRRVPEPRCPHRGGPLSPCADDPGLLQCPWHGYRFDAATGACLDDPSLRLRIRR
jgi:hypothetical protein